MASPNGNFTDITDVSERRKVQNRVAQKTYRARQKMRIKLAKAVLLEMPHLNHVVEALGQGGSSGQQDLAALDLGEAAATTSPEERLAGLLPARAVERRPASSSSGMEMSHVPGPNPPAPMLLSSEEHESDDSLFDFGACSTTMGFDLYNHTNGVQDCDGAASEGQLRPPTNWLDIMSQTPSDKILAAFGSPKAGSSSSGRGQAAVADVLSLRNDSPRSSSSTSSSMRRGSKRMSACRSPTEFPSSSSASMASAQSSSTTSDQAFGPVLTAIQLGNLQIARLLVQYGAKIDVPDQSGATPLHQAVKQGRIDTVRGLLDLGANVLTRDANDSSLLHTAIEKDNLEMVSALLLWCDTQSNDASAGADDGLLLDPALCDRSTGKGRSQLLHQFMNARDRRKLTPVHLCVVLERTEILKTLLEYGADVNGITIYK
ncbi:ankyrin repeat-containing domain protein [Diaporthe sp. PMI_573]|nr:ankyrin repeat-containing domain protein [Diaporthaceae sp. PMI_573]